MRIYNRLLFKSLSLWYFVIATLAIQGEIKKKIFFDFIVKKEQRKEIQFPHAAIVVILKRKTKNAEFNIYYSSL